MSQRKSTKKAAKPDKSNFFVSKQVSSAVIMQAAKASSDLDSDDGILGCGPGTPTETSQITKSDLAEALDKLSSKLISTWQHTADSLRKDLQELGKRTSHVEDKCDEFATAHNDLATHVEHLATKVHKMEEKMADLEDRSRRNNLRLRGVPEEVANKDLPAYVRGLLHAFVPEVPTDMLLVDRVHHVPKPHHIAQAVPRDILLRAHYHHIKEHVLRSSRIRTSPPEDYPTPGDSLMTSRLRRPHLLEGSPLNGNNKPKRNTKSVDLLAQR
ncbi:Hypothetical predicted protein [Pelobates cultripes]|uniref:Uncharacterized protein n=1 Tax=Pelobates cultripes TaxID=61616 RepID=A0AAD1TI60_PELCU|nr:Hypothetical predicted protein [Pelobates cultripes]